MHASAFAVEQGAGPSRRSSAVDGQSIPNGGGIPVPATVGRNPQLEPGPFLVSRAIVRNTLSGAGKRAIAGAWLLMNRNVVLPTGGHHPLGHRRSGPLPLQAVPNEEPMGVAAPEFGA